MIYSMDLDETAATGWLGNVSCANIMGLPSSWPRGGLYAWWVRVGKGPDPDAAPYNYGDSYDKWLAVIDW